MAKRNQGHTYSGVNNPSTLDSTLRTELKDIDAEAKLAESNPAPFIEGILAASAQPAPEAIAAAASVVADIVTGSADALKHADVIAAYYHGKKAGALELCAHLENNWGRECHVAAADYRAKLAKVPS